MQHQKTCYILLYDQIHTQLERLHNVQHYTFMKNEYLMNYTGWFYKVRSSIRIYFYYWFILS